jgi:hypothetical protein
VTTLAQASSCWDVPIGTSRQAGYTKITKIV